MTAAPTELYVCRKCKGSDRFVARLTQDLAERRAEHPAEGGGVEVRLVRCQDICKTQVAGLAVDGELVWFRRLRDGGSRRRLAKLAARGGAGPIPKRLAAHRAAERDGRAVRR